MPVRRRIDRHRPAELAAWRDWFSFGYDWFGHLYEAGIVAEYKEQPDEATARAAWQRCGEAFLAEFAAEQAQERYPREEPPHALTVFGPPAGRRRYAG
ncbi:MAG: hypothetical protein EOR43_23115 [Mesorhizobium sp.]|uniref:hypothetical protein n=1 Tax=Mesorhizobium sp. TaxID=1871066 RepID=UPI000FE42B4B|nr:hypothetical protein [Mesorhizobium sp.]RWK19817.1 MAG: hypothetical protein EOR43_23115 [Mesorhizobium sp.]RWK28822.1 MAG: hypothetical protein EOR44_22015 [Mesorhizobium sp.]